MASKLKFERVDSNRTINGSAAPESIDYLRLQW